MSQTEDDPEIMLEVCVDSVESANAYVAISRVSRYPSINALLAPSKEVPNVWNCADR